MSFRTTTLLMIGCLTTVGAIRPAAAATPDPFESWAYGDRGRLEFGVGAAGVTNDPFLWRGGVTWRVGIHFFELLALDMRWFLSPDRGEDDLKGITQELIGLNEIAPDISRMLFAFTPGVLFTPLHAEDGGIASLDLSLFVGGGIVHTVDDENLINCPAEYVEYMEQDHPAFTYGVNLRIKLQDIVAFTILPQLIHHTEEVPSGWGLNEETKNNWLFNLQVSFLTPEF